MPFADNEGIRIHYGVAGEGPPLVLQHGSFASAASWYDEQIVSALSRDYRLILVDARGHGRSDKPHQPEAYHMAHMVGDLVAVLDDVGQATAHFWGYSMGGRIGWWAAAYAPDRFRSLVLGGALPYGVAPREVTEEVLGQARARVEAILADPQAEFGEWAPRFLQEEADVEALAAYVAGNLEVPRVYHPNGLMQALPELTMPCPALIYMGQADLDGYDVDDNYLNCVKNMPHLTFITLPELDHLEAAFRTDLVWPHVGPWLARAG